MPPFSPGNRPFQSRGGFQPSNRPRPHFTGGRSSGGNFQSRSPSPAASTRNQNVKKWPNPGETVVVRIDKVLDYGVFCSLLEYENATGFVHISQVESSWIKNIRNYVSEGQMRAALVQKVDTEKLQIDLSLTKVSERMQRLRLEEYKQLSRNKKLIEVMAKSLDKTAEDGWKAVAEPLIHNYGTLPPAFEAIAMEGAAACEGVAKEWIPALVEVVQKNIRPPEKEVKGTLTVSTVAPNGVELVKSALLGSTKGVQNANVSFSYLGAGKYMVKVVSFDFKLAEKALSLVQSSIKSSLGSTGTLAFTRQEA